MCATGDGTAARSDPRPPGRRRASGRGPGRTGARTCAGRRSRAPARRTRCGRRARAPRAPAGAASGRRARRPSGRGAGPTSRGGPAGRRRGRRRTRQRVRAEPEELAAPHRGAEPLTEQLVSEARRPAVVSPHAVVPEHLHVDDASAHDVAGETVADGLDLGELRHRRPRPRPARPRTRPRPRSLLALALGLLRRERAVRALRGLLLGVLLRRPAARPVEAAVEVHVRREDPRVVRPDGVARVRGRAQPGRSRGLLERRLPVEPGTETGRRRERRLDELEHEPAGRLQAVAQVDRADDRLDRVGEDRVLVVAARADLALAEQHVLPQAEPARDRGERLLRDGRGPHLGEPRPRTGRGGGGRGSP